MSKTSGAATETLRVERARREVLLALEAMTQPPFDLDRLRDAVSASETVMHLKLRESVAGVLSTTGLMASPDGSFLFLPSGEYLQLNVARDPRRSDLLVIAALSRTPPGDHDKPFAKTRRLNAVGHYRELSVVLPSTLREVATMAMDVAVAVTETGCHWIADRIADSAAAADVALTAELYRELHVIVPEEELHRNLWFALVGARLGFRLLDPTVVRPAFDLIEQSAATFHGDTLELVAELVRTQLPRAGLLMDAALSEDRSVEMHFSDAQYSQEGSVYAVALRALYGSDSLIIMPILKTPRRSVLLLFPSGNEVLRQRLDDHLTELERICSRSERAIVAALDRFERETGWSVTDEAGVEPGVNPLQAASTADWTPQQADSVRLALQNDDVAEALREARQKAMRRSRPKS